MASDHFSGWFQFLLFQTSHSSNSCPGASWCPWSCVSSQPLRSRRTLWITGCFTQLVIIRWHHDGIVTGDHLLSSPAESSPHPQGRMWEDEPMLGSSHTPSFGDGSLGSGQPPLRTLKCPEAVMDQDQHQLSLALPTFPLPSPVSIFSLKWRIQVS